MNHYVDSSALAKLLVSESETAALIDHLQSATRAGANVVTAYLTETELRRVAIREEIDQELVTEVLDRVELLVPDPPVFRAAGVLAGPQLGSLDALHVATALRVDAERFVSYDQRQTVAATQAGLVVAAPA